MSALINLAMVGYIFWKLPVQPDRIPLHFNTLGQVDRIGQPREILLLPAMMLVVVVINGLQRVRPGVKVTPTVTTMEASGDSMQTAQRGE